MLTYADMMRLYAEARQLRRYFIRVPVLSPQLSSHWVHWMTSSPAMIARPLIEGLRNELTVQDDVAKALFPAIEPLNFAKAVQLALGRIEEGRIETIWRNAVASSLGDLPPVYLVQEQGMLIERRQLAVQAPPAVVFRTFAGIGGKRGWPAFNWLWGLRSLLDRLQPRLKVRDPLIHR